MITPGVPGEIRELALEKSPATTPTVDEHDDRPGAFIFKRQRDASDSFG